MLSDAAGEIARGLEVVEFACGMPHLIKGAFSENVSTGVDVYSLKQPLGVVGIISPFNFPAMVPMWFFPIAIAAGNTVVLKPSEKDPSAANWMAELLTEAGLPDGVFNVVHGDKEAVDALLDHPDVASISFVGSTPIAQYVYETGTAAGKRVQALGGAKNHMLVLPDADLDLVADSAVNAGFGSAGERCMAISVVLAVDPVADELIVEDPASGWPRSSTGDGRRGVRHGPAHHPRAPRQGGRLRRRRRRRRRHGGRRRSRRRGRRRRRRLLARPTAGRPRADRRRPSTPRRSSARCCRSCAWTPTTRASTLINSGPYGNGTAIFTNDGGAARRFQREVQVGMVGINVPIPVPVAYHSFGGWKASLFGDAKAYGPHGVDFFTREKAVTTRWLDPEPRRHQPGLPAARLTGGEVPSRLVKRADSASPA